MPKRPTAVHAPDPIRLVQDAITFAARVHRHQLRKDGVTPYVAHVLRVAFLVRDVFRCNDPVALAAAILHDTIEDCPCDYDDIEAGFGRQVADIVAALTKNMILREDEREIDYDNRLAAADWRARLIKLADAYDNLCDTSGISAAMKKRAVARAHRAIKLANWDAGDHPEVARGIAALKSVID